VHLSLWKEIQIHGHIAGAQLPFPEVNTTDSISEIWNLMAPFFGYGNLKVPLGSNFLAGFCYLTD
jgi:hypothetical protein